MDKKDTKLTIKRHRVFNPYDKLKFMIKKDGFRPINNEMHKQEIFNHLSNIMHLPMYKQQRINETKKNYFRMEDRMKHSNSPPHLN